MLAPGLGGVQRGQRCQQQGGEECDKMLRHGLLHFFNAVSILCATAVASSA